MKAYARADLDADAQAGTARILDGLRKNAIASLALAAADKDASSSLEKFRRTQRLEKALSSANAGFADLVAIATDLAERLGPKPGESGARLAEIMSSVPVAKGEGTAPGQRLLIASPEPTSAAPPPRLVHPPSPPDPLPAGRSATSAAASGP